MGSCYEGSQSRIDASVGGLVWVRRRNGSWWPGRILDPDELPASCPCQPSKGTPIQLLGREDGSVDWYNLEKSTRVKAFHCGEYDECINRAKTSAIISGQKPLSSGKYVRREDAILHALELEKVRFSNGNKIFSSGMNNTTDNNLATQLENMSGHSKKLGYLARKLSRLEENTTQELSLSVVSFEQQDNLTASDMQLIHRKRRKTPNDSEDDTDGIKRMRDLQDLGLKMVSKPNMHVSSKGSHELAPTDSASLSESDIADGFYSASPPSSSKDSCSSLKRKESGMVQVYENFKRKNLPRPLTKVWVGTDMVKIPSFSPRGAFAGQSSLRGATQNKLKALKSCSKKRDFSLVTGNSPGCSGTSCEETLLHACETEVDGTHLDYEMKDGELPGMLECIDNGCSHDFVNVPLGMGGNLPEDFSHPFGSHTSRKLQSRAGEKHSSQADLLSQLNEGPSETCSTSSATEVNHVRQRMDKGTSERYSKGQRISSCLSLSRNVGSENFVDWADQSNTFLMDGTQKEIDNNAFSESPRSDNSGQLVKCRSVSEVVGDVPLAQTPKLAYVDAVTQGFASENVHVQSAKAVNRICNSNFYSRDRALSARDVHESTLLPQELLPHRQTWPPTYTEYPLSGSVRSMPMNSPLYDVKLNVQASYQGPRVPLVSLVSKLNGKAIVGYPIAVEVLVNGFSNAVVSSNDCRPPRRNGRLLKGAMIGKLQPKAAYATKSHPNIKRKISAYSMDGSLLKRKPSCGKKSGFSSRKIRRLSSITVDRRDKEEERKPVVEKIEGPSISCVPLRLVFSRLNEALNSSTRPANCLASS